MAKKAATEISKRAVILILTLNALGIRRKIDTDKIWGNGKKKEQVSRALLNLTKKLIDAQEFRDVMMIQGEVRRYFDPRTGITLPSPFKTGTYALPVDLYDEAEAFLMEKQQEMEAAVGKLVSALPRIKDDMREKAQQAAGEIGVPLAALWDEKEFPKASKVREAFGIDWHYMNMDAPTTLSKEAFAKEREKIAKAWESNITEMQNVLMVSMQDILSHMMDRLAGKKDGKEKIFRDSMVTNMEDFLRTLDVRNISDHDGLKKIGQQMRKLLKGVTPAKLRESENLKLSFAAGVADVKKQLDKMITLKATRRVALGD